MGTDRSVALSALPALVLPPATRGLNRRSFDKNLILRVRQSASVTI